jgi:UDP-glucose 4-epimerase
VKKNILVTGGTGFIGSHTSVELIEAGYNVLIADDLSNSDISVVDKIEQITGIRPTFVKVDLSNAELTHRLFEQEQIDAVIHFAAKIYVDESVRQPLLYYKNNLCGLLNILQEMKNFGIKNLVFSSSCTVYGVADQLPVTEQTPIKPATCPYGNTKQISEEILHDMTLSSPLKAVILRYFNPIGAHSSALIGEVPKGVPQHLLPYITQTAMGIRECLQVFGNDYQTKDGTCLRDYIHVVDLAKSHVAALSYLFDNQDNNLFDVFNIGTGEPYSVLDVINAFESVTGLKINYKMATRRPGDVEKIWANPTKAQQILNWKAQHTLSQMVESAWKWQQYFSNQNKKP